jgi:hypothetical protein
MFSSVRKRIAGEPLVAVAILALAGAGMVTSSGCHGPSAADPPPPSGGRTYVLDFDTFAAEIDPILTANGCDNIACHGGGIRGTFELSPSADKDVAFDFDQAVLQVNGDAPAASPLLMKPLAEEAGGSAHAADPEQSGFMSTSDPDYEAILAWIESGEYQ